MNANRTLNRIESVRVLVQEMMMSIVDSMRRQNACVHLHGVSAFASMLAMKRGQKHELAAVAGLLHGCAVVVLSE